MWKLKPEWTQGCECGFESGGDVGSWNVCLRALKMRKFSFPETGEAGRLEDYPLQQFQKWRVIRRARLNGGVLKDCKELLEHDYIENIKEL